MDGCRDILEKVALNPNLGYGFVVDLKNDLIYLYSHDDFERTAVLDLKEELAKGIHSYAIETLVTQQTNIIKPYIRNSLILSLIIIIIVLGMAGGIYFFNISPVFNSVPTKEGKNEDKPTIVSKLSMVQPKYRFLIAIVLCATSFVIFKSFIKIGPIYITFDWTSLFTLYLTIFLILLIGTNFRPAIAFILSSLGIIVDELFFCLVHGYGGELWIQLIISTISFVGTAVIISKVRQKNTAIAFFMGGLWYLIGFFIPAYFYFCVMFYWYPVSLLLYQVIHLLIYIALIPVVLLFNKAFRELSHKQNLEGFVVID